MVVDESGRISVADIPNPKSEGENVNLENLVRVSTDKLEVNGMADFKGNKLNGAVLTESKFLGTLDADDLNAKKVSPSISLSYAQSANTITHAHLLKA